MKIAMLHGQNHVGSSCTIGRMLAQKLGKNQEITEFFLPRDLNHFCCGCYRCLDGDENCPFYGEKQKILQALDEADLLIFTTPTYCMGASALMKSFLDLTFTRWIPHRPAAAMFHKQAAVISTEAGVGAGAAVKQVKTALSYWGVPKIRTYGAAVQAMGWDQVSRQKKEKIQKEVDRMAKKLQKSADPRPGLLTKCKFLFLGRMMQQKGMGSSPYEEEYWQAMGWLESARPW